MNQNTDAIKFDLTPYIQDYIVDHPHVCPKCHHDMSFCAHHFPLRATLFKCLNCTYGLEVDWDDFDVSKLFSGDE